MAHQETYRVYFEDTDAGGIVYHANYLRFCERSRTEMLRSMGFESSRLYDEHKLLIVARRLEADYLATSRLDDLLDVKNEIISIRNTSFVLKQTIYRQNDLIFSMDIVMVFIDESGKPTRMPDEVKTSFQKYMDTQ